MIEQHTRLRLGDDVTFSSLGPGQETVVLSLASGYLYTCNDTTREFLGALDGQRSFGEVIALLEAQFDAPAGKLQADMTALAQKLLGEGLIQLL